MENFVMHQIVLNKFDINKFNLLELNQNRYFKSNKKYNNFTLLELPSLKNSKRLN